MSIYSYKTPSGKISWVVDILIAGKPRHRKKGFLTKTEAKDYKAEFLAKLKKGEAIVSNKLNIATYLEQWLKDAKDERGFSDSTEKKYSLWLKVIIPEIGHVKIKDLTIGDVKAMRQRLLSKPYKPSYVSGLEVMLKCALSDGEEKIGLSPIRKLKGMNKRELEGISGSLEDEIASKKKPIKWFEPWEQKKLLQTAWEYSHGKRSVNLKITPEKNLIPYMLIYLALNSGMRRGELYALVWSKINFDECTIHIDRTVEFSQGDTKPRFTTTKTGEDRTIAITRKCVEQLKRYRLWVKEKLLPLRKDINEIPVFFASDFGLLHSTQPNKQFSTIVRQAGLKHRRFHDMRHSHCSNLVDKEIYPPVIQERLGHAKLETTMSIYAHFFKKRNYKLVDALEDIEGGLKGEML